MFQAKEENKTPGEQVTQRQAIGQERVQRNDRKDDQRIWEENRYTEQ